MKTNAQTTTENQEVAQIPLFVHDAEIAKMKKKHKKELLLCFSSTLFMTMICFWKRCCHMRR